MRIRNFPESRQTFKWDCGANAMQSVLAYYGIDVGEKAIIKLAGSNFRNGTTVNGMKAVAKKYNFKFKAGKMTADDIKKYLDKKIPVILLLQAWANKNNVRWEKDWADGHFVVAIGYDSKRFFFEDPAANTRTFLAYAELNKRWHDVEANKKKITNWGLAMYGKEASYSPSKSRHMN